MRPDYAYYVRRGRESVYFEEANRFSKNITESMLQNVERIIKQENKTH